MSRYSISSRAPGFAPFTWTGPVSGCAAVRSIFSRSFAVVPGAICRSMASRVSSVTSSPGSTSITAGMSGCQRLCPLCGSSRSRFARSMLMPLRRMCTEDVGHASGQPLRVVDVQELVRAVGVGVRPEHAGDEELRLRKLHAEHRHERDGAALAHPHGRLAVVFSRSVVPRLLEPRRELRRMPAGARLAVLVTHLRAIRRVFLEDRLEVSSGLA